ncbi:MAG: hypothetical protein Q9162_000821 [Coniocarpon cinnabarinum]
MNVLRTSPRRLTIQGIVYVFGTPPCRSRNLLQRTRTFSSAQPCLARNNTRRKDGRSKDDKFDINVIEERITGDQRKRRRLSDEDIEEDIEEDQNLEKDILDLEKGLGAFKVSAEDSEDMKRAVFSKEDLARLEEEDYAEQDMSEHHILPQHPIPMQSQVFLQRLNEALDNFSLDHGQMQKHQSAVWRWYTRCKNNVPRFLSMIPKPAWDLLWRSQATDVPENIDRLSHLAILSDDKLQNGWSLTSEERYVQIEGTFMEGDQRKALQLFEELSSAMDAADSRLLEMGVRMYAHHGDPQKAHRLADQLFELDNGADPRVLMPVISAYADQRKGESVDTAWSLYQEVRRRLSSDMQMPEYDTIVLGFLGSGHKDFALAVFRDMMLRGEGERRAAQESAFSKLSRFIDLTKSPQETTELSLNAIEYLPRRFQNKWFYASWLRKLISEGQVNAAAQVVELMYERGVKPDAKHMNGIMAAWLRDQRASQKELAEQLGWTMIQRRLDFVQERQQSAARAPAVASSQTSVQHLNVGEHPHIDIPVTMSRPTPPATIETFCILAQHYIRQGLFTHVFHLHSLLEPAELQINAFFMNQLLSIELRTKEPSKMWQLFLKMSASVKPDLETWTTLWDASKNYTPSNPDEPDLRDFPTSRELFRDMMEWFRSLRGQEQSHAIEDMDEDVYRTIIQVFALHNDLPGIFVAMHTLHSDLKAEPTESVVRALLHALAKLMPNNVSHRDRRDHRHRPRRGKRRNLDHEREMVAATYLLDTVRKQRLNALAERGIEYDDLSAEAQSEENHRICLAMLVRVIQERYTQGMKSTMSNEESKRIQVAAEECGVAQIDVEKALAVEVRQY